jgi:hypothetical protein
MGAQARGARVSIKPGAQAPGALQTNELESAERATDVPGLYEPFVVFDPVFIQDSNEFITERKP